MIVTDADGCFVGTIAYPAFTSSDVFAANNRAGDLTNTAVRALTETDDLRAALNRLKAQKVDHLPVVRQGHLPEVVGVVRETSILRALLRARSEEAGEA